MADPIWLAWVLFFLILPIANALLDWPSWAVSRWLGHDLHDLMRGETRRLGRWLRRLFRAAWQPVAFAVHIGLDLVAALVTLLALAALLPFLVQLFNHFAVARGVAAPLELGGFLDDAVMEPWPKGFWPLSMLATTLIPTALHAGALLISVFLWLIQPAEWRQSIVAGLQSDGATLAWAAARASGLVILTPIVCGGARVPARLGARPADRPDRARRPAAARCRACRHRRRRLAGRPVSLGPRVKPEDDKERKAEDDNRSQRSWRHRSSGRPRRFAGYQPSASRSSRP